MPTTDAFGVTTRRGWRGEWVYVRGIGHLPVCDVDQKPMTHRGKTRLRGAWGHQQTFNMYTCPHYRVYVRREPH